MPDLLAVEAPQLRLLLVVPGIGSFLHVRVFRPCPILLSRNGSLTLDPLLGPSWIRPLVHGRLLVVDGHLLQELKESHWILRQASLALNAVTHHATQTLRLNSAQQKFYLTLLAFKVLKEALPSVLLHDPMKLYYQIE